MATNGFRYRGLITLPSNFSSVISSYANLERPCQALPAASDLGLVVAMDKLSKSLVADFL